MYVILKIYGANWKLRFLSSICYRPETFTISYYPYISPNGFVHTEHRRHSDAIAGCVGKCKFQQNTVELAVKLIEAHHNFIRKESYVAIILEKGIKMPIENNQMDVE